jgi:hypothetical protein
MGAVASFAVLQLGWFACVLGAAHGAPWAGPPLVFAALALHLRMQPPGARATEGVVLACAAALGFVVDTAFVRGGVIALGHSVSPPWLVAMWPNTAAATAPGGSLSALARRPVLAALLGAVAAALAYDAGARLGAIELEGGRLRPLVTIGVAWSGVLPALFALRGRSALRRSGGFLRGRDGLPKFR